MSKISIIVPCYNTAQYIRRCLDSLIQQTFSEIEILCIDDGSTDNTLSILKEYEKKDSRIRVFHQENDKGPGLARNVGLENATSPYTMFCDADDWYEPNMCELMYETIEKEKTDIVQCHTFFDYEKNYDSEITAKRRADEYYNPNIKGYYNLDNHIILASNEVLWNKIFRTDMIRKSGVKFERHIGNDDSIFWFSIACYAQNIFYIHQKLYHYFFRSDSIMDNFFRSNIKTFDRFIFMFNKICVYLKKKCLHKKYRLFIETRYNIFLKQNDDLTAEQLDEIMKLLKKIYGNQYFYYNHQVYQKKSFLYFIIKYLRLRFSLLYSKGKSKEKRIEKINNLISYYKIQNRPANK